MNQEKIGKFIAECRKEKNLTQSQLAEKLNMSDKSISKWETGKGMPDSSIMLELCNYLGIGANELLSGEHLEKETYQKKADENIICIAKEAEESKKKIKKIIIIVSAVLMALIIFIIGKCIWESAEFNLEYDGRIIKCEINEDNIKCEIIGSSIVNFTYEQINTENETLIFFTGKMLLKNKIRSHFESWDSMAELANGEQARFGSVEMLDISKDLHECKDKIKIYYTNIALKKIKNANQDELQKIIEQSSLMVEN